MPVFRDSSDAEIYYCEQTDEELQDIAKEKGCELLFPKPDELFIDLDSEEAYTIFRQNHAAFQKGTCRYIPYNISASKSGLPHRHVIVKLPESVISEYERVSLQFLLGSDPKRESFNTLRLYNSKGKRSGNCFFKKK